MPAARPALACSSCRAGPRAGHCPIDSCAAPDLLDPPSGGYAARDHDGQDLGLLLGQPVPSSRAGTGGRLRHGSGDRATSWT